MEFQNPSGKDGGLLIKHAVVPSFSGHSLKHAAMPAPYMSTK